MLRFIVRRLLVTIPTILVVITITWALIKLAPGNFYSGEKPISPAIEQAIREMKFRPNARAQSLGRNASPIISFILSNRSVLHPFHARVLQGGTIRVGDTAKKL